MAVAGRIPETSFGPCAHTLSVDRACPCASSPGSPTCSSSWWSPSSRTLLPSMGSASSTGGCVASAAIGIREPLGIHRNPAPKHSPAELRQAACWKNCPRLAGHPWSVRAFCPCGLIQRSFGGGDRAYHGDRALFRDTLLLVSRLLRLPCPEGSIIQNGNIMGSSPLGPRSLCCSWIYFLLLFFFWPLP